MNAPALASLADIRGLDVRKPEKYRIGDLQPACAFAPRTIEALAALHARADELGAAVVAFGGGTLQGAGWPPVRFDIAVAMDRLSAVVEHEPHDLTIAVQAGCTVAGLANVLGAAGQFVPLDAPRAAVATTGGTLAAGWVGPRRGRYGRPRDLVIGTTVVLADGTVAKAGGMVVKNVTGYDASKLYGGSLGTLGTLARLNFKTLPLPARVRVALAPLPEHTRDRALEHVNALLVEPSAVVVAHGFAGEIDGDDGAEGRLFVLLEGSEAVVERATRDLRSALGAAGVPQTAIVDTGAAQSFTRLLDAYVAPGPGPWATYRSFHPPELVERYRARITACAHDCGLGHETIVDARNGDITLRAGRAEAGVDDAFVCFDARLREIAPQAVLLAGESRLRATLEPWGAPPSGFAKMRALKERFDPRGTLAPGRFIGRI